MFLSRKTTLVTLLILLPLATASPLLLGKDTNLETRNVSALRIRESLPSNAEFSKTTAHGNKDDSSARENDKRGTDETIMELYFVGCSLDVYRKVAGKPSEGVIPTPYYFSPQGGLYLTHRIGNAEAMGRSMKCPHSTIGGHPTAYAIITYKLDEKGLSVMDLDKIQHLQSEFRDVALWWNYQSLHVIPVTGVNPQNKRYHDQYLSSDLVIGTLKPASTYANIPGLTDLWTLWVLRNPKAFANLGHPVNIAYK